MWSKARKAFKQRTYRCSKRIEHGTFRRGYGLSCFLFITFSSLLPNSPAPNHGAGVSRFTLVFSRW